jgi:hypothetical protein
MTDIPKLPPLYYMCDNCLLTIYDNPIHIHQHDERIMTVCEYCFNKAFPDSSSLIEEDPNDP